jgi:hypothetical protein
VARPFSKIEKLNVIREKLLNLLLHKKCARKMLMKLSPGVNFLCAAFMRPVPKSTKETDDLTVFFCTFGISVCKSCMENVGKINSLAQFHQPSMYSFYARKILTT